MSIPRDASHEVKGKQQLTESWREFPMASDGRKPYHMTMLTFP